MYALLTSNFWQFQARSTNTLGSTLMNGFHNAARPPHYDFFPPEVLDPRVLEAWAPAAEARITRVKSEGQLIASRSHKAR